MRNSTLRGYPADLFIERFRADGKEVLFRKSWQLTRRRTERDQGSADRMPVDVEILRDVRTVLSS